MAETRMAELVGGPRDGEWVCIRATQVEWHLEMLDMPREAFVSEQSEADLSRPVPTLRGRYVVRRGSEDVMLGAPFDWQGWE